jgi:tRNA-dihydrouridine synthase 2
VKTVGSQGKSVTCKIRLLENIEDTVNLVRSIEQTGVNAIAVHARYVPQRSREKAHLSLLPTLKQAIHIPLIANGDCFTYEDIDKVKQQSGCNNNNNSVMIARGAIWNPSIFSSCEELRSKWCNPNVRALEMLQVFEKQQNYFPNTKFIICRMYSDDIGGDFVTRLSQTQDYGSMKDLIYRKIEREISN